MTTLNIILVESTLGFVAAGLFLYKNPQRDFASWIAVLIVGIFFSKLLIYSSEYLGLVSWAVTTTTLITLYTIRFRAKHTRQVIDYLKWMGLILLVSYPLTSRYYNRIDNSILLILATLSIPILGAIYIYDRWILKPEQMKRKYIAVLVIQSLGILLISLYALVQREASIASQREAIELRQISIELRNKYEELLEREKDHQH